MKEPASFAARSWSVVWPPFAVVAGHSLLAVPFGHRTELDPIFHFLGGVAGALSLWRALELSQATRFNAPRTRSIAILVVMLAVVLLWELAEFGSDRFRGTHIQRGWLDTGSDIVLGLIGAAVTVSILTRAARR
jgi:hypothetical protein